VAAAVAIFILVEAGLKITEDVANFVDRFGASERSARLTVGAFELGGDLPMAIYGGDLGGDTGVVSFSAYESRIVANVKLLGLEVEYPPLAPPDETIGFYPRDRIVLEEIRPSLAGKDDHGCSMPSTADFTGALYSLKLTGSWRKLFHTRSGRRSSRTCRGTFAVFRRNR